LILRLACSGARFRHLSKVLHTVRRQPVSVSSNELRVRRWMGILLIEQHQKLRGAGVLTPARSRAFAALLARQGRVLLRYGARELARQYYQKALQMHPTGIAGAYKPAGYVLYRSLGPVVAEKILQSWKRLVIASREL